jgi:hypothetical protein
MIKRRRIEIIAFERERIVMQPVPMLCPVCRAGTEMLTTRQAAALVQIKAQSVRRWLARGWAHGARIGGRQHRVCRASLFVVREPGAADALPLEGESY